MDAWGIGSYEDTAQELAPAAGIAVGALGALDGVRVLDVACGTGNAAAVAADAGAQVTGLDGSERLVGVAAERVPAGEFVVGDAAAMPFDDGAFDAAVSVFGVIFAQPAQQAAAEIARVVRPGGRIAVTTWPPRGPAFAAIMLMRQATARVRPPEPGGPAPVNWGDPAVVHKLLGPFGEVWITERILAHDPIAPEELFGRWERSHPMWIGCKRLLEPAGEWDALREGSIAALRDGGVQDGVRNPYLLVELTRA